METVSRHMFVFAATLACAAAAGAQSPGATRNSNQIGREETADCFGLERL